MEIVPGVGLPFAKVGQTLPQIEAAVGPATVADAARALWDGRSLPFATYFDDRGRVRVVEVYGVEDVNEQVTLDGVQLTLRLIDDVEADLSRLGRRGRRAGPLVDFPEGFTLWSLGELFASDLTPGALFDPSDDRPVVEGVAIVAQLGRY